MVELDPRTPVIVGVGQIVHRDGDAPSPAELAATAARVAAHDAGRPDLAGRAQIIATVPIVSWRYHDGAAAVARLIDATPSLTMYPAVGGNTPQMLVNRVSEMIVAGETDIALVCGAEAYRTRMSARRDGTNPEWARQDDTVVPGWTDDSTAGMVHESEMARGIMMPTQSYPLFESALRHRAGRTSAEHTAVIAEMWEGFSAVAATNPHAWDRVAHTADEIATPTADNRVIGTPYTKLMVSNPSVDMASAAIICSVSMARSLGIATDRWVFVHSGSEGADPTMSERRDFVSSDGMSRAGRAALDAAGVGIDDISALDVYSCFPSAVELACAELAIPTDRTLTVYGGLCFGGGPWNNPVGHAIAAMTDVLRASEDGIGLVTANGGIVGKHAFGVYGSAPPVSFRRVVTPSVEPSVNVVDSHTGPATVEAFTVMAGRDGAWERAHLAFRTADGHRGWAVSDQSDVMESMATDEWVGQPIDVTDSTFRPAG